LSFISFFVYSGEENTTDTLLNLDFFKLYRQKNVKNIGKKKPVVNLALIHTWGVGVRFKG
jgi:hypothetical protein